MSRRARLGIFIGALLFLCIVISLRSQDKNEVLRVNQPMSTELPQDHWKERVETLQRIEAELTQTRLRLRQRLRDPINKAYRARILDFLALTEELHTPVIREWEKAIRARDTRRESGYGLDDSFINVSIYQMNGVIDDYRSGVTPIGRAASNIQDLQKDITNCENLLHQYSQNPRAVRLDDPVALQNLLNRSQQMHDEGAAILARGDELGALLAWVEASFLVNFVHSQAIAGLGLLEPAAPAAGSESQADERFITNRFI